MSEAASTSPTCTICFTEITVEGEGCACPACFAPYHRECWDENGGCGVYGCKHAPVVQPRDALEIPVSQWGQEHKDCPACGSRIAAAAVRCRQCGASFASANQLDAEGYRQRSAQSQRLPGVKRMSYVVFAMCIIPCLAPFGVPFAIGWWLARRKDVAVLPAIHGVLVKIGIGVGIVEIIAIVVLSLLLGARTGY